MPAYTTHRYEITVPNNPPPGGVGSSLWNADDSHVTVLNVDLTNEVSGINSVAHGGTGVDGFVGGGYVKANGTDPFTVATGVPASDLDLTGLDGVLYVNTGVLNGGATTTELPEGTNLYYTTARARSAISAGAAIGYNSTTGVITNQGIHSVLPDLNNTLFVSTVNGYDIRIGINPSYPGQTSLTTLGTITTGVWQGTPIDATTYVDFSAFSGGLWVGSGILQDNITTGIIAESGSNFYFTDARARAAISAGTGLSYDNTTGVIELIDPVDETLGGTGLNGYTLGDIIYSSATDTLSKLAGNTTTTRQFLSQTGNGTISAAPMWTTIDAADIGSGVLNVPRGGTGIGIYSQGDIIYAFNSTTLTTLPKNTNATRYLANTGTANAPAWAQIDLSNGVTSILGAANGGTTFSNYDQGDLIYATGATTLAKLSKNTSATRYLSNTGTSNNPAWAQINLADGVTGTLPTANAGLGKTSWQTGSIPFYNGTTFDEDNTDLFYDSANGRVGLGTTSPQRRLHISGSNPEMMFTDTDGTQNWHIGPNTNDFGITQSGVATRLWLMTGGNIGFNGQSFGSGAGGVIFIANCSAVPTTNPSGGGILYVTGGALRYRGSSGTVGNLASA